MKCLILVVILFLMCIQIGEFTLPANGSNVCGRLENGETKLYCCYNFYEESGQCKECKTGTFSEDGLTCKGCPDNSYGYQCFFTCTCEKFERCDPVLGCVFLSTLVTKELAEQNYTYEGLHKTTEETNSNELHKTTESTNPNESEETFQIYVLLIGGFISLLLLCVVVLLIVHNYRARKTHRQAINNREENTTNRDSIQLQEAIYNEIDDIPIQDTPENPRHSYLSVIDVKSNKSNNSSDESYMNGNLSIIVTETTECAEKPHEYDDCETQIENVSSTDSENNSEEELELHQLNGTKFNWKSINQNPYQPLNENIDIHSYK